MADQRTMAQLLQAPTEGYDDAIVVSAITADNFELKQGLLTLFPNVPNTLIKLMLFPFSLEGAARIWLEKEPSRSIFTWDDLVWKFIYQFVPPSETTNLCNEITNFQQRFDEFFIKAWDRFKDLLLACPHHGFSELHQLDTFYNALNSKDQDSLNSAAGGNFLDKMPRECLAIVESKSKVRYSRNKPVVAKVSTNASTFGISPDVAELKDMVKALLLDKKSQNQSPAIVKAVEEIYVVENEPETTKDTVHPTNNGSTEDVQPQVVQFESLILNSKPVNSPTIEPVISPVSAPRPNLRPSIPYPSRMQDQKLHFDADPRVPLILGRSFLKTGRALIDVFEDELTLRVGKEAITFNLNQTSRYSANYNDMMAKRIDVIDMACKEYSQEVLGFSDVITSGNLTPYYDLIVSTTSPTLTLFKNSDFLLEEVDAFLAIDDDPSSLEVDQSYLGPEGDILLLESFLNDDPSLPLQIKEIICPKLGWRVCIDYRKLNEATRKDHFPLPFMDQKLERLAGNQYYCFLNGFSGYFQIPIDLKDHEKPTFTCPYGTFAYRHIPFGLCNAPGTFQSRLSHLERMLKRCEDTNLCLNWEKSHFMVKKGIVIGHKISKQGIEVDKAKVDAITKLPHPTTIKVIQSFLDWDMPFELMCDASDFAIGAVLGKRQDKHFRPIHYASKTMTETESNYTTMEKEMLAVEFTFKVIDIKGAENLATDHLSRLENPHQNVLDPKEINESFPLKTLNFVSTRGNSSTPWFVDFANYHARNFVVKGMSSQQKTYKTPIECTPYKLVYGKAYHLPIELEHKAYRALKHANFDMKTAGDHIKVQINELYELHDQAYGNSLIYKEKTKRLYDSKIKDRVFNIGDRVLLFNSCLKIFYGKLKSRWSGPFTISQVYPYVTIELSQPDGPNFKVNGHRLKHYFGEDVPKVVVPDLQTFSRNN
nr:reverse transcriptase domain-containing protein [Tanacetum cinerariifolium]